MTIPLKSWWILAPLLVWIGYSWVSEDEAPVSNQRASSSNTQKPPAPRTRQPVPDSRPYPPYPSHENRLNAPRWSAPEAGTAPMVGLPRGTFRPFERAPAVNEDYGRYKFRPLDKRTQPVPRSYSAPQMANQYRDYTVPYGSGQVYGGGYQAPSMHPQGGNTVLRFRPRSDSEDPRRWTGNYPTIPQIYEPETYGETGTPSGVYGGHAQPYWPYPRVQQMPLYPRLESREIYSAN